MGFVRNERIEFWVKHMDQSYDLLNIMSNYPIKDNGENLLSIHDAVKASGVNIQFANSNFSNSFDRIFYIREGLIDNLINIGRQMNSIDWILCIEDAYRTKEMQKSLFTDQKIFDRILKTCIWECNGTTPSKDLVRKRAMCLVAVLPRTGTHLCGAAIDISVSCYKTNREISRGAKYLEMDERTPMESKFISSNESKNRKAISKILASNGFVNYPGEFWHYNKGDSLYQMLTNSGNPAIYGPINWEAKTNTVHPFENINEPLIQEDYFDFLLEQAINRFNNKIIIDNE